jgi:hypothetical protein
MIKGYGKIVYDPSRPGMKRRVEGWCIAEVDREVTRYLRWWINRKIVNPLGIEVSGSLKKYPFVPLHQPSWDAHISIVRGEYNRLSHEKRGIWRKYHGKTFEFQYDLNPHPAPGKPDFWIVDVVAPEMMEIRRELGLRTTWPLHLTVGRTYIWGDAEEE